MKWVGVRVVALVEHLVVRLVGQLVVHLAVTTVGEWVVDLVDL